jgi:hypothetical protein
VIGRSFSFQLLTAISLIDVDELFNVIENAQQMGIIVPSSEGPEAPFTFAHELVRQPLHCLQLFHSPAGNEYTRASPKRSSGSIRMLLTSAPGRSLIICSRQGRSLTNENC